MRPTNTSVMSCEMLFSSPSQWNGAVASNPPPSVGVPRSPMGC